MADMDGEGRRETVRYHEDFYAHHELFKEGSWLYRPAPFVLRSFEVIQSTRPMRAVDLGSGVGRHTIPVAQRLPRGSYVVGLDLLPSAAALLSRNARAAGLTDIIQPVVADLGQVALSPGSVDLLVSVSALEHAADLVALEGVLRHCQEATRPSGLHCLIIGTEKVEIAAGTTSRPARVEFPLSREDAEQLFARLYSSWEWLDYSAAVLGVDEKRDGEAYTLRTTNIRLLARRPARS